MKQKPPNVIEIKKGEFLNKYFYIGYYDLIPKSHNLTLILHI
jgi:hypothetical protein